MSVLGIGIVFAPYVAETYPIFSQASGNQIAIGGSEVQQSIQVATDVFQTQISQKPRPIITTYTVEGGDTLSSIAKKFGVTEDSIKWANDMTGTNLGVGDELKIPSVTGIIHKVARGDTVYTIADKYGANPQAIVDFPFNDFANPQTFSLVVGQLVMIPGGVKPEEKPKYVQPQRFIATGPITVAPSGFAWPLNGSFNQDFSWYHPGIDIGAPVGSPIVAAQSGIAAEVYTGGWNGGYGIHVIVHSSDGTSTLYAHMNGVNVSAGQAVTAGSTVVGWVGLTGRTTGPHLHFEVRNGGAQVNPLSYLPR